MNDLVVYIDIYDDSAQKVFCNAYADVKFSFMVVWETRDTLRIQSEESSRAY